MAKVQVTGRLAPRVILAKNRKIYGESQSRAITENAPLSPLSIYDESKVEDERLLEKAQNEGINATTIRPSSVHGSVDGDADRLEVVLVFRPVCLMQSYSIDFISGPKFQIWHHPLSRTLKTRVAHLLKKMTAVHLDGDAN